MNIRGFKVSELVNHDKIRELRNKAKMSQNAMAKAIGTSRVTYRKVEEGTWSSNNPALIERIAEYSGVPVETLILEPAENPFTHIPLMSGGVADLTGNDIYLPIYRCDVEAGGGLYASEPTVYKALAYKEDFIKNKLHTDPENLCLIEVWGDSMSPTLADGDLAMVDTSKTQLATNAMYAFRDVNTFYIRRIDKRLDGTAWLVADNKMHEAYQYNKELHESMIFGRIVMSSKMY